MKSNLRRLFSCVIIFFSLVIYSQKRALYVDNFANILGSETKENKLLEFAKAKEKDELILYDLHKVNRRFPLGDAAKNGLLANFISKAKTKYNIKSISASGETANFFIKAIHPYNVSRTKKEEQFDVYNLEYEYWNERQSLDGGYYCETYLKRASLPCNRENSFNYFVNSLFVMKELAKDDNLDVKIEAYVGRYTRKEIDSISHHVDRLLIHDYVTQPEYSFLYVKDRLNYLDAIHSHIDVSILFSAENNFMGKWLRTHDFKKAEEIFFKELEKKEIALENHLNFAGFTYYNYSYFKKSLELNKN